MLLRLVDTDHPAHAELSASQPTSVPLAQTFAGRARAAEAALIDGAVGLVWASGGRPRVVFSVTIAAGKIVAIEMVAEPARLNQMDVAVLSD